MAEYKELLDIDKLVKELASKQLEVGFFETARYEDGTPVAGVASIQEFGSVANNIPPRPFFNPAIEKNEAKYSKMMAKSLEGVIEGKKSVEQTLSQLGAIVKGDIQTSISQVQSPPLSPRTIKARTNKSGKSSTKPLVDTGLMIQSVDYEVSDV